MTRRHVNFLILILIYLMVFSLLYGNQKSRKEKKYDNEKITLEVKKEFDELYPLNKNLFYLYKGENRITFKEFMELSQDPTLTKNQEKAKKIKITGITLSAVFLGCGLIFLVPTIIFIARLATYDSVYDSYFTTGVVMAALTGASVILAVLSITITFALLYRFKYNEAAVRDAVEKYNDKLRKKLGLIPDISYNINNDIRIGFHVKI